MFLLKCVECFACILPVLPKRLYARLGVLSAYYIGRSTGFPLIYKRVRRSIVSHSNKDMG